jgi:cytoskeletal protein CcmA (bactofilin family)
MFGKKPPKPQTRIDSLIGAGTRIEGNVIFAGGLRIDGEVRGDVRSAEGQAGTLVISEHARVEGQIAVAHLVVNGTIAGPVHVSDFVELQPRSRVTGDVHYTAMEMHLGAVVDGQLVHKASVAESKPVELKLARSQ